MGRAIRLLPDAQIDILQARAWYRERSAAAAQHFIDDLDRQMRRVQDNPHQFPVVIPPLRRARLKRFPFALYFLERTEGLLIVACFHARRDPARLTDRV